MSKYDKMVQNDDDIHAYIHRMVENAKQKGIMITAVFVNAPCIDRGCDCITPYGQAHPELLIGSCGKCGLEAVARFEKKRDEE